MIKNDMKKIGFLLLTLVLSTSFIAAQNSTNEEKDQKAPKAEFISGEHNFGKIKSSDGAVTCEFTFKNVGDAPLIIQRVSASCGCTSPSYTAEPVLPGKEGQITVKYSAVNNPGAFDKKLTVFTNAPSEVYILTIKGEVILK